MLQSFLWRTIFGSGRKKFQMVFRMLWSIHAMKMVHWKQYKNESKTVFKNLPWKGNHIKYKWPWFFYLWAVLYLAYYILFVFLSVHFLLYCMSSFHRSFYTDKWGFCKGLSLIYAWNCLLLLQFLFSLFLFLSNNCVALTFPILWRYMS